jgi:polar amino acid transport system substrate-binding protein
VIVGVVSVLAILVIWVGFFQDRSLVEIRERGVIRIGYAIEAPYAFLGPDGSVTGESPELARKVVATLGINKVDWVQVDFDELIGALDKGRIDVIAAGMFITPERMKQVAFSMPTFRVTEGMLVPTGNPRKIHSSQDAFNLPDFKVATIRGAVEVEQLTRLGFTTSRLVLVPDARTGLEAVNTGLADGLALSSPTVQWMAMKKESGLTEPAKPFSASGPDWEPHVAHGAFAFRKHDNQLRREWDRVLATYLGSAEHRSLMARFGFTETDLPDAKHPNPREDRQ